MPDIKPNQASSPAEPRNAPAAATMPNTQAPVPANTIAAATPEPMGARPERPSASRHGGEPLTERLPEHVAGMLTYLFGWVSGLVFLLFDRRPFVRYHAAQSVVVFATLSGLLLVFGDFFLASFLPQEARLFLALRRIVELTWLFAAVVLMLKASTGQRYRVPHAAEFADRAAQAKV
jgi:uncharacterized membrane protein